MEDIIVDGDLGKRIVKYRTQEKVLEAMMQRFYLVHRAEETMLVEEGYIIWRLLHEKFDLDKDSTYSYLCNTTYNPPKITIREIKKNV